MSRHKKIKINNIVGCVLYYRTFDIGGVCGVCGVCGVYYYYYYYYYYMIDIYKSNYNIMNKLVYNDIRMFFVSFNNNKIGKVIVKKGA